MEQTVGSNKLVAMPQSQYDIRFVAYYSLPGGAVGTQSRVSTTVANGLPLWRTPNSIEFCDEFVEINIPTNFCDFINDNRKDSSVCGGWVQIRRSVDQHIMVFSTISFIQTYTAGSNNVMAMRCSPAGGNIIVAK